MNKNSSLKILIAHHAGDYAHDASIFFEGQGFETSHCDTIKAAREMLNALQFDIVLLSLLFPDGNGLEFCRSIKKDVTNKSIKVILLSSISQSGRFEMEARSKYLADDYIEEPIPMQDLFEFIQKLVAFPQDKKGFSISSRSTERLKKRSKKKKDLSKAGATELDSQAAKRPVESQDLGNEDSPAISISSPTEMGFAQVGSLVEILFPELLLQLYQSRATGNLHLRHYSEERDIYFKNGVPQYILTNFIQEESLSQLLIFSKTLDETKIKKYLEKSFNTGEQIGDLLFADGLLTKTQLASMLKKQASFKIINAFKLIEGQYSFDSNAIPQKVSAALEMDVLRILIAGVTKHLNLSLLEKKIFDNRDQVVFHKKIERVNPQQLGLSRNQWALVGLADGERTLGDIIADSKLNFQQTFQTIYLLFLFGLYHFNKNNSEFFFVEEPVLTRLISDYSNFSASDVRESDEVEIIPETGDLSEYPMTQLLYKLYSNQETGILFVDAKDNVEKVILRKGDPVKIETVGHGDLMLGELLVQLGMLTEENRAIAVEQAKEAEKPLGEFLIGRGLISPHNIFEILSVQLEKKLQFIFELKDGSFKFERINPDEVPSDMIFNVNIGKLAVATMKKNMDPEKLEQDLIKYKGFIPEITSEGVVKLNKLFIDSKEIQLFDLINGRRTIMQIVDRSPMKLNETLCVIFLAISLGLLRFVQD